MRTLSPEDKTIGQDNYHEAIGFTRREFLQGVIAAGAVSGAGLGAMYFGYEKFADPVRVGVIGSSCCGRFREASRSLVQRTTGRGWSEWVSPRTMAPRCVRCRTDPRHGSP